MTKKPTRFVTVCVRGYPAQEFREKSQRLKLFSYILQEIDARWPDVDAIVFPGGYFPLNKRVGRLAYRDRVQALKSAGIASPIRKAIRALRRSRDAVVFFGVDGPYYPRGVCGDQLCVASDRNSIVGIARKVFPVKGKEANSLLCYDSDFEEPRRLVKLRNRRTAIMAACYDMFGIAERGDVAGIRARLIRYVGSYEELKEKDKQGFAEGLQANLAAFKKLLSPKVTVGIAAIHKFDRGSTGFWQRHGIAACSAALGGGYAIGAAHFVKALPRNPNSSTLAAARVPKRHLIAGHNRKSHSWLPMDHFVAKIEGSSALVRLFSQ